MRTMPFHYYGIGNMPRELRDVALAGEELTPREKQILKLCANGHVGKEIADKLSIAEDTVKSHFKNILPKLQARTRAHAVAIAVSLDMI